jgi:viroplasmin and RNaseH domain-containing protein
MAKKTKKEAYVVFRGRKPGVYRTWLECEAQVNGFSNGKQRGFDTFTEASAVWEEWQRKSAAK